jgi:hypothetical protein
VSFVHAKINGESDGGHRPPLQARSGLKCLISCCLLAKAGFFGSAPQKTFAKSRRFCKIATQNYGCFAFFRKADGKFLPYAAEGRIKRKRWKFKLT